MFTSKAKPTWMKLISGAPLYGRSQALRINIRQGWKDLPVTNALAYYKYLWILNTKSFVIWAEGAWIIRRKDPQIKNIYEIKM